MNEEYKKKIKELRNMNYSEKEHWAKVLDNLERVERKKNKKRRENELLLDDQGMDLLFYYNSPNKKKARGKKYE